MDVFLLAGATSACIVAALTGDWRLLVAACVLAAAAAVAMLL